MVFTQNSEWSQRQLQKIRDGLDKPKQSYENTVALACAYLWLKL